MADPLSSRQAAAQLFSPQNFPRSVINVLVRAPTGKVRVFSLHWELGLSAITAIPLIHQRDSDLTMSDYDLYAPKPGTDVAIPEPLRTTEWSQSFADDLQQILKNQCRSLLGYELIRPSQPLDSIHLFVVCKLKIPELEYPYQLISPKQIDVKLLTVHLQSFKSWCKRDLTENFVRPSERCGEIAKLMHRLDKKRNIVRRPGLDACFDCLGRFDLFSVVNPTEGNDNSEDDGDDNVESNAIEVDEVEVDGDEVEGNEVEGNEVEGERVEVEGERVEVDEVEGGVDAEGEGESEGEGDDNNDKEILQFSTAGYGEFLAYFTVATNSVQRTAMRLMTKDGKRGSSQAEGTFVNPVIAPPCQYSESFYKQKTRPYGTLFQQNLKWAFPLVCSGPKPGSSKTLMAKYIPRSGFSLVTTPHFFPLIIGEVQSKKDQSDKWRMLLQGAAIARLAKQILKKSLVVVAIYVDLAGLASVYFMCQSDASTNTVFYNCVKYNFQDKRETLKCMRLLYNYVEMLEEIINDLEAKAATGLVELREEADELSSLTSAKKTEPAEENPDTAPKSAPKKAPKRARQKNYEDQEIMETLVSNNVIILNGKLSFPHIAYGVKRDIASSVKKEYGVTIKIVDRDSDEQSILQFLSKRQGLEGSQYVMHLQDIWFVRDTAILVMPFCDKKIKHYFTLKLDVLYSFTLQVVKGLRFLHQNSIAHLDLKPDNIFIQSHGMRLLIADFSVSEWLTKSEYSGFVGTKGWAAPEVDSGSWNMIRADLWSCGKVIEYLCLNSKSPPAAIRNIFKSLLDLDPDARPTLDRVLTDLQNYTKQRRNHDVPFSDISYMLNQGPALVSSV